MKSPIRQKWVKGLFIDFFSNKDDLFFQTATSGFDELCDAVLVKKSPTKRFTDQLLSICAEIEQFFSQRRQLFRMMQIEEARVIWGQESMWGLWLSRREKLVKAVSEILDDGVTEKKIRSDVPTTVLADFLLGIAADTCAVFCQG